MSFFTFLEWQRTIWKSAHWKLFPVQTKTVRWHWQETNCNRTWPPRVIGGFFVASTAVFQKYFTRHNAALKTLFFEIVHDNACIESVPPWYSPVKPKPVYEADSAQTFWDVPVFAVHEGVTANRVEARIIDHHTKRKMLVVWKALFIERLLLSA